MEFIFVHVCVCVFFLAWAKVKLTMHESVEVHLGESAQIPCQYSFTNTNDKPGFVMIQWFVVSTAGPPLRRTDTVGLELLVYWRRVAPPPSRVEI